MTTWTQKAIRLSAGLLPCASMSMNCEKTYSLLPPTPYHPVIAQLSHKILPCDSSELHAGPFPSSASPLLLAGASGSCLLKTPVLLLNKEKLSMLDHPSTEFVLAHEFCHLANNDLVWTPLLAGMSAAAFSILFKKIASNKLSRAGNFVFQGTGVLGTYSGAEIILSRRAEKRADLQGFSHCSQKGARAAIHLFREKMQIPEYDGDLMHPSFSSRVAYLEREYERKFGEKAE